MGTIKIELKNTHKQFFTLDRFGRFTGADPIEPPVRISQSDY